MNINLSIQPEALRRCERPCANLTARVFDVSGFNVVVHAAVVGEGDKPSDAECAQVIVCLAMALMAPRSPSRLEIKDVSEREDGPGPDMEAGWNAYREQLAETMAIRLVSWKRLDTEIQEAFSAGVWAAIDGKEGA